jgi:hypothetical protein
MYKLRVTSQHASGHALLGTFNALCMSVAPSYLLLQLCSSPYKLAFALPFPSYTSSHYPALVSGTMVDLYLYLAEVLFSLRYGFSS